MDALLKLVRRQFTGVSWQNPAVRTVLQAMDPLDYLVRVAAGRGALPRYSIRVRSNGVRRQFGGRDFARYGDLLAALLQAHAGLTAESRVLEIGCGCGRVAIGLAGVLREGGYTGVDIEPVALRAAQANALLRRKGFHFHQLTVRNAEYNPGGDRPAESYVFPFADGSFEVIFLISVFTHMLPGAVRNYIGEIGRMLAPGGAVLLSSFLMDHGLEGAGFDFTHQGEDFRSVNAELPEKAVGYDLGFFDQAGAPHGLARRAAPLLGGWRRGAGVVPATPFPQDLLVYFKAAGG